MGTFDFDIQGFTIEEWELLLRAKKAGPEEGRRIVLEFYAQRAAAIMKSDELCDFEKEEEYSLEGFHKLKQSFN